MTKLRKLSKSIECEGGVKQANEALALIEERVKIFDQENMTNKVISLLVVTISLVAISSVLFIAQHNFFHHK